jgi:hypothetical protein
MIDLLTQYLPLNRSESRDGLLVRASAGAQFLAKAFCVKVSCRDSAKGDAKAMGLSAANAFRPNSQAHQTA